MNSDNIQVARPKATGVFFGAPSGTTLPSDADTALASAYVDYGYVSEDGITESIDDTAEVLKEMGGAPVIDTKTGTSVEYKLTPLEMSAEIETLILGVANVTLDASDNMTGAVINGNDVAHQVFVFDMRLRGGKLMRIVIPNGVVSAVGEGTYKAGAAFLRELTITCFPDASGNFVYKYFD